MTQGCSERNTKGLGICEMTSADEISSFNRCAMCARLAGECDKGLSARLAWF
jgi:hypothetical protein